MAIGFKNIPKLVKNVNKVDDIISSSSTTDKLSAWIIGAIVLLIVIILYLLYKSNKCACMPELTELRDELMDTVVESDIKLRSDIRREKAEQQREHEKEEEAAFSLTYSSPAYKPQLIHKAPSTHGYDLDDSPSTDGGGNQVTDISELQGDGFTVLDTNMLNDVQNGVVNLDTGGTSESWMQLR